MQTPYHRRLKMLEQHGSMKAKGAPRTRDPERRRFIEIYVRQNGICLYCDGKMALEHGLDNSATVDHLTPRSHGGTDARWNLGLACYRCNQDKGDRTYDEYVAILEEREKSNADG